MADILQAAQDQINDAATKLTSQSPPSSVPLPNQPITPGQPTAVIDPSVLTPAPQAQNVNPMIPQVPMAPANQFSPTPIPTIDMASMPMAPVAPIAYGATQSYGAVAPTTPIAPSAQMQMPSFAPQQPQMPTPTPVETINLGTQFTTPAPLIADGANTLVVPPQGTSGGKKSGPGKMIALIAVVLLLVTVPVGAYFLSSNNNLADTRSRAEGTCDNGVAVGGTACQSQGDSVMYRCDAPNPNQVWTSISCNGGTCQGTACTSGSGGGGENTTCSGGVAVNATACNASFSTSIFTCQNPNGNSAAPTSDGADPNNMWARASCPSGQTCIGTTCQAPSSGNCSNTGESCDSRTCCTGGNLVCQGQTGSRICNDAGPGGSGDEYCKAGTGASSDATCNRFVAFKCNSSELGTENGQTKCEANPKSPDPATWSEAISYAGSCGQADVTCSSNSGNRSGKLCGDFYINTSACAGPTNTPIPVVIQCQNLTIFAANNTSDITSAVASKNRKLVKGESLWLHTTAGSATAARFRIGTQSNWSIVTQKTGAEFQANISVPNNVSSEDTFQVQICSVTPGADGSCSTEWN